MNRQRPKRVVMAGTMALLLHACTTSGLAFREDQRLAFAMPEYRQAVALPITVEWTMDESFGLTGIDGSSSPGAGLFAVLIDRRPPPPGEGLDWYSMDDVDCQRTPGCPDGDWFRQRGIHATTQTSLDINRLARRAVEGRRDFHEVTIVLLDGRGRRIGESAWTQVFELVDDHA